MTAATICRICNEVVVGSLDGLHGDCREKVTETQSTEWHFMVTEGSNTFDFAECLTVVGAKRMDVSRMRSDDDPIYATLFKQRGTNLYVVSHCVFPNEGVAFYCDDDIADLFHIAEQLLMDEL